VAELCFTVRSNQTSTFLSIEVEQSSARTVAGSVITSTRRVSSELAVIGNESLLIAAVAPDGTRALTLVGRPGATYAIEYTTSLAAPATWTRLPYQVTLTTVSTNVPGVTPPPSLVFYRAFEVTAEPPRLEVTPLPDGKVRLTLEGQPGKTYAIQYTPALVIPWTNLVQFVMTNSPVSFEVPTPGAGTGFYRAIEVVVAPPVLKAALNSDGTGSLLVHGAAPRQYTLQYNTNLARGSDWYSLLDFTLTNENDVVKVTNRASPIFYRLRMKE
jgi:hypothetical protein